MVMTLGIGLSTVLSYSEATILIYFLVGNSCISGLLLFAIWNTWRYVKGAQLMTDSCIRGSQGSPRITVISPAYNEVTTILQSVRSVLNLCYPKLELVIVNDGSVDGTLDVLIREFGLEPFDVPYIMQLETREVRGLYRSTSHPNLVVVDKENGGKPDALNAGLNIACGSLVCLIDADTLVDPQALQRLVVPFSEDDETVAVGAFLGVANGCYIKGERVEVIGVPRGALAGFQLIEYIRSFSFGRIGWNSFGGNLIISGAFGLFRRESLITIGGFTDETPGGEDMELILHLRRHGYERNNPIRIQFVPWVAAWTEVPESMATLGRQRTRWHRGLAYVLWHHRKVLANQRYRSLGFVAYPYFLFVELLAPVVESLGLLLIVINLLHGQLDYSFALAFWLVAYGYSLIVTLISIILTSLGGSRSNRRIGYRHMLLLFTWMMLESFGYRQLTVYWRLKGLMQFFRGETRWGAMHRRGFGNHK